MVKVAVERVGSAAHSVNPENFLPFMLNLIIPKAE
jgi:hypothetical protein